MFEIKIDDLTSKPVIALLEEHLAEMAPTAPPESRHALDLSGLRSPEVKFWALWDGASLAGCAAYKELDDTHAEVKSMRTASNYKKQGVASMLLAHLIKEAQKSGYKTLSLETGSMGYFKPARSLYEKHGFSYCPPFADYAEDPNSVFMSLKLN